MLRRLLLGLIAGLLAASPAGAITLAVKQVLGPPGWVLPFNPDLQFDFARGWAWKGTGTGGGAVVPVESLLTVTRATPAGATATDLLPTSAAGFPFARFVPNQLVRTPAIGSPMFGARTNLLLNSTAPATQTTGSLANATYTLWVNEAVAGSGASAKMSAGTATGCGTGTATQGSPVSFTTTGAAGTCVVTVTGSLAAFQLEAGTFGTPLVVTAGATAAQAGDVVKSTVFPNLNGGATLFVQATPASPTGFTSNQYAMSLADSGAANNYMAVIRTATGGNSTVRVVTATVAVQPTTSPGTWAQATSGKLAGVIGEGTARASFNGSAVASLASGNPVASLSVLAIGNIIGGSFFGGTVSTAAVWGKNTLSSALMGLTRP